MLAGAMLLLVVPASLEARAASDLASLLASAPSADWVEASPNNQQVIEGPFTAKSYGDFVDRVNASPSQTTSALESFGLTGGYGKEWMQLGSSDLLVERVFQFSADSGATSWYDRIKAAVGSSSDYRGTVAGTEAVPDSFGAVMDNPEFRKQWAVDFRKSNLVFVVHADSHSHDMTTLAVSQAKKEYDGAPDSNVQLTATAPAKSWLVPAAIGAGVLAVLLPVVLLVAVIMVSRRRRTRTALAAPIHMSPDGAYWWDGISWRDARTDIPALAMRSPDGYYWWDGAGWRPVGPGS